jgi:hypothetical protein
VVDESNEEHRGFGVIKYTGGQFAHCEVGFGRFLEIATGSVFELVSESMIPRRQHFQDGDSDFATIYSLAEEQG